MRAKSDRNVRSPTRSTVKLAFGPAFLLLAMCLGSGQVAGQSTSSASSAVFPSYPVTERDEPSPEPPAFAENGCTIIGIARSFSANPSTSKTELPKSVEPQLRLEQTQLANGTELLTIFGRLDGLSSGGRSAPEVPMISIVRDTLGDTDPENDRLRYVWMLTYTQPSLMKRIAAAIPFLYQHVGNQQQVAKQPKPIIDLANVRRETWNKFLWFGVQNFFLDTYGLPIKVSTRNYRRNLADYRNAHVMQAISILSNYENLGRRTHNESELLASSGSVDPQGASRKNIEALNDTSTPLLSASPLGLTAKEMFEVHARLIYSGETFGGLASRSMLRSTVEKRSTKTIDIRDHNWEMLRQRAEAEGLYFEPLTMPDGSPTHALLWIAKSDLAAQSKRDFQDRFLNIADPWNDGRLRNWNAYTQIRYLDADNRVVTPNDPQARRVEMIPLALFGLDHPKIPALLIDFRDGLNPKKREVSRRVLHDIARNIFSLSSLGNIPYFLGSSTYDFITGRRGMDVNQPSRLQSYSELKLLLSFSGSIDPKLRTEIEHRLENVSMNPLSNDNGAEVRLAQQQYAALMDYARRPDGLPARVERDREAEMMPLKHGQAARVFFTMANVLSFGHYVHREKATPELTTRMELQRRIRYHSDFLREVAKSSPQIDVVWDMNLVRRSLQLLADQGAGANGSVARAASKIFERTNDEETRRLCLDALYKINDKTAKNELLRLYRDQLAASEWKAAIADRLRKAVSEDPRMKPAEVRAFLNQVGQP